MRKLKDIKKEILDLLDLYCKEHRVNLHAEITQEDNDLGAALLERRYYQYYQ